MKKVSIFLRLSLLALTFFILGCSGSFFDKDEKKEQEQEQVKDETKDELVPPPVMVVSGFKSSYHVKPEDMKTIESESEIYFGNVKGLTSELTFTITNSGEGDLNLHSFELTQTDFTNLELVPPAKKSVPKGEKVTFVIKMGPHFFNTEESPPEVSGELTIKSNDPAIPLFVLYLTGSVS